MSHHYPPLATTHHYPPLTATTQRQAEVDAVAAQQQKQLAAIEAVQREKQQRKQVTQTFFQGKAANPFFQQTKDAITQKRALEQQQSTDGGGELIDMSGEGGGTYGASHWGEEGVRG